MERAAAAALCSILQRVQQAAERVCHRSQQIRLVGFSKTKSVTVICQVYDAVHRYFGENYVQELIKKAPQGEIRFKKGSTCERGKRKAILRRKERRKRKKESQFEEEFFILCA